ncbi:hypothetical protein MG293_010158 [Ovis ammon polii]|uniref:Uncharacterized protein n=1 Tax=Ovis ammon polii TaxID=230172 RepID=A0AAD4U3I9_OVIAM|nr:hypothetical protein MG293_010158 [Ovis ammon polii]KAI4565793.1 hypothetical protein MJT46_009168 [Ovis ammon polii x Ovis aries]
MDHVLKPLMLRGLRTLTKFIFDSAASQPKKNPQFCPLVPLSSGGAAGSQAGHELDGNEAQGRFSLQLPSYPLMNRYPQSPVVPPPPPPDSASPSIFHIPGCLSSPCQAAIIFPSLFTAPDPAPCNPSSTLIIIIMTTVNRTSTLCLECAQYPYLHLMGP